MRICCCSDVVFPDSLLIHDQTVFSFCNQKPRKDHEERCEMHPNEGPETRVRGSYQDNRELSSHVRAKYQKIQSLPSSFPLETMP